MLRSMPLALLRSSNGTGLWTAFWAAKISLLFLGLASTVVLVRLAIPLSRDLLLSTLPSLCATVGGYLAPPYIFVVVNFMILVILKLPDARGHIPHKGPPEGAAAAAIPPKPTKDLPPSPPEIISNAWSDGSHFSFRVTTEGNASASVTTTGIASSPPGGWSDESYLTTDFEGDSAVSPPASAAVVVRNTAVGGGAKSPLRPPARVEEDDNDSMDATWKAITGGEPGRRHLKKNETWSGPSRVRLESGGSPAGRRELRKWETFRESPSSPAAPTRGAVVDGRMNRREVPAVEDHDEMNRQFEAFIKKVNDQMRLQREQSALRSQMEMVNSSGR